MAGSLLEVAAAATHQAPRAVPSCARLEDWDPPTWRVRIGAWRIFFEIDDARRIVFLTAADHRKGAYR